jgi:hypothetical protein
VVGLHLSLICTDLPGDRYHRDVRLSSTGSPRVSCESHLGHTFWATSQVSTMMRPQFGPASLFYWFNKFLLDRAWRTRQFLEEAFSAGRPCVRTQLLIRRSIPGISFHLDNSKFPDQNCGSWAIWTHPALDGQCVALSCHLNGQKAGPYALCSVKERHEERSQDFPKVKSIL